MKRYAVLALFVLSAFASSGCDTSDGRSDRDAASDRDAGSPLEVDATLAADANISGYYICAFEPQPFSPASCNTSVNNIFSARLIVVEHDGLADIGMVSVAPNSSPVWHGTVSANGAVTVTGMAVSDTGQLTATVNPNSLRDVRLQIVRASPACTQLFVGVCALGGSQF